MFLIKKGEKVFVIILFFIIFAFVSIDFSSATSIFLVPETGHCFTPLTAGQYTGNYLCTDNITSYDNIMARIKVDDNSGYGWVNSTWTTNISNYSIISSAIINTSIEVTAMANVIMQTQIFNNSAALWMNVSGCSYTFTSSNNIENKICDISAFISRGSEISSLIVRSLAYRTSGGGAEEKIDHQVLTLEYAAESAPSVILNSPFNGTLFSTRNILFNASFLDDNSLINATLYIWNSTSTINTTTVNLSGMQNQTAISVTLPYDGVFFWNYLTRDAGGNSAFNETNFTFEIDTIAPNIYFVNPLSYNYSTTNISINLSTSGAQNVWVFNGTANETYNSPIYYTFAEGYHTLIAYANDSAGNINSTSVTFSVDITSPTIVINEPANESIYGTNINIPFSFSIIDSNRDSCWYSVDHISNITLPGCVNTTFNTTGGSHDLFLYANDSAGNFAFSSTLFSVNVGSPGISLISPINSYLNYGEGVSLVYIPSGLNLATCSLFGNFNGTFSINQTTTNPVASISNSFSVDLDDGQYSWAISCNNTFGNSSISSNKTFYVDTVRPSVTINSPVGTYSSLANIPLNFNYTDASPVRCFYNITFAATGNTVVGNSELEDCLSSTFTLDTESSYFLWMSVNDSAGNVNNSRNSFTISIPSGSSSGGGSSGGGGSGRSISGLASFKISFGELDTLKINRGKSETIELPMTNKGTRFLNSCYIYAKNGISSWISGEDIQSLSPGQTANYIFTVNVPINAQIGDYFTNIGVNCIEFNETFTYHVEVVGGEFELNVLDSERVGTKLRVNYVIENFASKTKDLVVNYKLINDKNLLVVEGSFELVQILSGERTEKIGEFELPKNSVGDYILIMEVSDGLDLTQQQQDLRLTNRGISGFAISDNNLRTVAWFGVIIILCFSIFIATKILLQQLSIRRARETPNRQFITID